MADYFKQIDQILRDGDPLSIDPISELPLLPNMNTFRGICDADADSGIELLLQLLASKNGYSRKAAAWALGQLGELSTSFRSPLGQVSVLEALRRQKTQEKAQGNIEAIDSAIVTLTSIPKFSGSTEVQRAEMVEISYTKRTVSGGPTAESKPEKKGFFRSFFE